MFSSVKDETSVGEASVSYLHDRKVPELIHDISPNAKIIISLRDPVERAYSHFLGMLKLNQTKLSFHEAIQTILDINYESLVLRTKPFFKLYCSFYAEGVKRYLDTFGTKQVKIIIFEEFIQNPKKTVTDVIDFLDVEDSLDNFIPEIHNSFKMPRGSVARFILGKKSILNIAKSVIPESTKGFIQNKILLEKQPKPKMDEEERIFLINYFQEDVKNLKKFLDRDLPWPNFH